MWQLAHPKIVDDEERHSGYGFHVFLASAFSNRIAQVVQEHMGIAIEDLVALQDHGLANRLCQVTLDCPRF